MYENWAHLLRRPEIQFPRDVLESVVRGKRVLITGAGGSIGASLARLVSQHAPEQLVVLDSHEASLFQLRERMLDDEISSNVRYVLADLRDRSKVEQVFRRSQIDVVFHLAAYKHVPFAEDNVDQVFAVNVIGTLNVVQAATEYGASAVVYPSSDKAVTPLAVYAASKRIVERVFQSLACETDRPALRIVRLVNVFETQGNVIEKFIRQIRANQPVTLTDPRMDRYWMTRQEATHLLIAAATRPTFEGFYMLDVGEPVLISDTARRLYEFLRPDGGHLAIRVIPIRPGERLHEELKFPTERFRSTERPGLLVIETPPPTVDAKSWLDELTRLSDGAYGFEPGDVKARLIDLASRAEFANAGLASRPAANV